MDYQGYCVRVDALEGYVDKLRSIPLCLDYSRWLPFTPATRARIRIITLSYRHKWPDKPSVFVCVRYLTRARAMGICQSNHGMGASTQSHIFFMKTRNRFFSFNIMSATRQSPKPRRVTDRLPKWYKLQRQRQHGNSRASSSRTSASVAPSPGPNPESVSN